MLKKWAIMATVYENVSILTSTLPDFDTPPISPFSLKPFHTLKFLAFFLSLKMLFLFPIDVIQSSLFAKHIALAFIYTTNLWFSSNVILAKISTLQCCRCRKRGFVPVKYFTRHLNGLNIDNTVICVSASFYLLSFWDIYQPHFPSYTRTKQTITKDND